VTIWCTCILIVYLDQISLRFVL